MSNDGKTADDREEPGSQQRAPAGGQNDAEPSDSSGEAGLSMLELMMLPTPQRDIALWLTRNKNASFQDIEQAFQLDDLDGYLTGMIADGYIREEGSGPERIISVILRHTQKRVTRQFPEDIWSRVDSKSPRRKDSGD